MPETRTQEITYTIESPKFVTTGPAKGTLEADLVTSIGEDELARKSFTLGGETMAKFMFAKPDASKSRWQDFSDCLYAVAIEAGFIPKP